MTTTRTPGAPVRPTLPPARRPASAPPRPIAETPIHAQPERHTAGAVVAVKRIFAAEGSNYFLLLGTTLFLVALGLVMVLSSSSVDSYRENHGDAFTLFLKQGSFALVGVPLMLVASRLPAGFWKKWAWLLLVASFAMQLAVFIPGLSAGQIQGNTNWIKIGGFTAQPSEFVKLALIVWIAYMVARRQHVMENWKYIFIPVLPAAGLAVLLVMAGNDLGTALIILAIVGGCLFFSGLKIRYLLAAAGVMGLVGLFFAATGGSRSSRISLWLTGCPTDTTGLDACWQPVHGTWALASGGIFGVGLGNSKMKWSWLPAAENDYIFAIIGEELGLIGAIVVLLLFITLTICIVRIVRVADDPFARIVSSGVLIWIVGQAFVNVAVVLGLLPVLGVPLPLISAGGSALIANLLAIGIVLSLARGKRADDGLAIVSPAERSRMAATARTRAPR